MARKKLNKKRIDFYITETNYQKLLLLCNEEKTFALVLNEAIEGRYYHIFNTNTIITQEQKNMIDIANINLFERS